MTADLVFIYLQVYAVQVYFHLARLFSISESTKINPLPRVSYNDSWFGYLFKLLRCLFLLFFNWLLGDNDRLLLSWVSHFKYFCVFDGVWHHRAFINHFSWDSVLHIQSNTNVRVYIKVHALKLKLVVKCSLFKLSWSIKISSKLDEVISGPSLLNPGNLRTIMNNYAPQDHFYPVVMNFIRHLER